MWCSWIDETFLVELFCHILEVLFSLQVRCIWPGKEMQLIDIALEYRECRLSVI